jgi:hypothetical protein
MCYRIAGIDVHKRMLAVVVADVATEGDYEFERRQFGANPDELRRLADWLVAQNVQEVVSALSGVPRGQKRAQKRIKAQAAALSIGATEGSGSRKDALWSY